MCGRAKMALSTVKGDRTRKVAYYDNVLRDNILYEQELSKELEEAIAKEHLQMYLQPQTTADEKVIGAEALIRWNHPERGTLGPDVFIPVFERNGLITEVDKYMWEAACKQLRKWTDEGRREVYISVNISPKDFYFVDVYQTFVGLLDKYRIEPKQLKLEITESAVMRDFETQKELINKLRSLGFVVEMDDFGSAYSSLNMLKDIDVDVIKLDMGFLQQSVNSEKGKSILRMVVGLSKQLGIPVISEGVETREQLQFLQELGCEMFQGFYLGRPMDVQLFEIKYL
jgi:EAL domain-containing protein (putative c-di-GMP-specific phosphodiesterase class I)